VPDIPVFLTGGIHEGKDRIFERGQFLGKSFAVLLQRPFFAGALNRGIFPRRDRPNYRPVLELNHGVDGQVGSICFLLFQSRLGEFYTELELELIHTQMAQKPMLRAEANFMPMHLNRPQDSLQNHYGQQPDSRHYAANDGLARGCSCSAFHYSNRSE
jgi:hypothetical protein